MSFFVHFLFPSYVYHLPFHHDPYYLLCFSSQSNFALFLLVHQITLNFLILHTNFSSGMEFVFFLHLHFLFLLFLLTSFSLFYISSCSISSFSFLVLQVSFVFLHSCATFLAIVGLQQFFPPLVVGDATCFIVPSKLMWVFVVASWVSYNNILSF